MATTIGVKMQMDGAAQFKADLQNITQKSKELAAEMKAAAAGADNQAEKQRILGEQIDNARKRIEKLNDKYKAQEKALQETNAQLEEAKKTYGEDSEEVRKLTLEVTKQETALSKTKTEVNKATAELNKFESQMDGAADETKDLTDAEKQNIDVTGKLSGGFSVLKGALANLAADGIRKVVDGFKDLMTSGPAFADEILTLASTTHLATDTLQELSYMSDLVDVDVSTVAGSMKKLVKAMGTAKGGTGAAAETFAQLGVSVVDANGELRNSQDVFFEVIDALGGIENEVERDSTAMAIFGKSASELNPMIEAGSDQLRAFSDEAREMGYVLDNDSLAALGRVQDEFDRFGKLTETIKNQIAAGVAPAIERGMKRVQTVLRNIDWNRIGKQIGAAFEKLIDAFEWILNHGNQVKAILVGIATAMAASHVTNTWAAAIIGLTAAFVSLGNSAYNSFKQQDEGWSSVTRLSDALKDQADKLYTIADAYRDAEEARNTAIDAGMAEMAHVQTLKDELIALADENGNVAESDRTRAEFILGELNTALGTEYTMTGNVIDQYGTLTEAVDALIQKKKAEIILQAEEEAYRQAILNKADAERELQAATVTRQAATTKMMGLEAQMNAITSKGSQYLADHRWEYDQLNQKYWEIQGTLDETNAAYREAQDTVAKYTYDVTQYETNMQHSIEGNYDAIQHKSWETTKAEEKAVKEASSTIATETKNATSGWQKDMENTAANIPAGVAKGIRDNTWKAVDAAKELARNATIAYNSEMQIKSPSRVMMKSGRYMVEGLAQGIKKFAPMALDSMTSLSGALSKPVITPPDISTYMAPNAGATVTDNRSNSVVINVYGAEGQDANVLADIVIDKLQRTIIGSEAVYA